LLADRKLGNYFWYSIGEIFLVVVGILIALQINNWNNERIERMQIREYALSLAGDLQRDMQMLEPVGSQIDKVIYLCNELADYLQGRPLAEISNIDLYIYTLSPSYRPFAWNRAALEQLKNSGALRQIKNQQLVRKISEYDALSQHMDQDYTNDENRIQQALNVVMAVVNMNYPNSDQIPDHVDGTDDSQLALFFNSDIYREIKSNDLPLLTNDINQVNQAANGFIAIGGFLQARTEHELPSLKAHADEIMALIEAEYGQ
jgi:hypothetical protein